MTELQLTSPALIVVDIQSGTLPNAIAVPAEEVVENSARLASAFRLAGHQVIFVVSTGTAAGITSYGPGGRVWPDGFDTLEPRLSRTALEPILRRTSWSAFVGTELESRLQRNQTREVVVVGLATTFGVESTARSASDLGFDVVVVADAISDPDPAGHARSLARVFPVLGRIYDTSEIEAALRRSE